MFGVAEICFLSTNGKPTVTKESCFLTIQRIWATDQRALGRLVRRWQSQRAKRRAVDAVQITRVSLEADRELEGSAV